MNKSGLFFIVLSSMAALAGTSVCAGEMLLPETYTGCSNAFFNAMPAEKGVAETGISRNIGLLTEDFFRDVPPVGDYDWHELKHAMRIQRAMEKAI